MAVVLVTIGLCISCYTAIQMALIEKQQGWTTYLSTASTGFSALGLFFGVIAILPAKDQKSSLLMIINAILLVLPFLLFNLFDGVTVNNLLTGNFNLQDL